MLSPWQTSRLFISTLVFHLVGACGSDPKPVQPPYVPYDAGPVITPQAVGGPCQTNADCKSGDCAAFFSAQGQRYLACSGPCTLDSDCQGDATGFSLKCGIGEGGAQRCIPACGQGGVACVNNVPVLCSEAKPESCGDCGCPQGLVCWDGVGCKPPAALGEACRENSDCEADNCSVFAQVCRVAVGAACTDSNCDLCVTTASGTYCSRKCDPHREECGDGFFCTTYAPDTSHYCRPSCSGASDSSCAGQCTAVAGQANSYSCECSNCQTSTAPREFGNGCDQDEQCVSGDCLKGQTSYENFGVGFCTKACNTSAECGTGWSCVSIPCIVSDLNCGNKCAKNCDPQKAGDCEAGVCQTRPLAEGGLGVACGPG